MATAGDDYGWTAGFFAVVALYVYFFGVFVGLVFGMVTWTIFLGSRGFTDVKALLFYGILLIPALIYQFFS